jgi:hypothetical protein
MANRSSLVVLCFAIFVQWLFHGQAGQAGLATPDKTRAALELVEADCPGQG